MLEVFEGKLFFLSHAPVMTVSDSSLFQSLCSQLESWQWSLLGFIPAVHIYTITAPQKEIHQFSPRIHGHIVFSITITILSVKISFVFVIELIEWYWLSLEYFYRKTLKHWNISTEKHWNACLEHFHCISALEKYDRNTTRLKKKNKLTNYFFNPNYFGLASYFISMCSDLV